MEDLENGAVADEKTPEDEKEKNKDRFVPTEQRSAVDSTRRSDSEEDRRQSDEEFEGEEKRYEPARRSQPDDRREITHAVICKTSGSLTTIEDWLDDHCEGEWNLILDALDDDLTRKSIRVMFELAGDKEKFIQVYGRGGE